MDKTLKIILVILLFLSLGDMSSEYYFYVKYIGFFGFSILSYYAKQHKKTEEMKVYICLALLFQPFFKVFIWRLVWNLIYYLSGVFLLVSIYKSRKKIEDTKKQI